MMPTPKVVIDVRMASGSVAILDIQGEINAFAEEVLMEAHRKATSKGARTIVLNFNQLEFMNSSGIGLIVTLLIRVQRQKQRMMAFGLTEHYKHILELTRINEAILIFPTEKEVLAAAR